MIYAIQFLELFLLIRLVWFRLVIPGNINSVSVTGGFSPYIFHLYGRLPLQAHANKIIFVLACLLLCILERMRAVNICV